jgi:hypothetical protein
MTCWNPFIEFRCNVSAYSTCCPAWLTSKAFIGSWSEISEELKLSAWEIWNHKVYQDMRNAVLNGDFATYCQPCSRIIAGHLEGTIEPWMKPVMEQPPRRIWLEHDRHCQLTCPSCRDHVCGHVAEQDNRDSKVKEICREFFPTATELTLLSSGDPLMSQSSLEILSWLPDYPHLDVELFTNGLLIPIKWSKIGNPCIKRFNISVDACTKTTYEKMRHPAKWEQITESLHFVAKLSASRVQLNFVVQADNFHEIPGFIKMTKDYGFNVAHLARIIRQWYHTDEQWMRMNVFDSRHILHNDFLKIMKCSELDDTISLYPTCYEFRR